MGGPPLLRPSRAELLHLRRRSGQTCDVPGQIREERPVDPGRRLIDRRSGQEQVEGGPAESAGLHVGDLILEVAGESVSTIAAMFRLIWGLGEAGVTVPFRILRNGQTLELSIDSVDRYSLLKSPHLH